jgi:hypothetical protein
MGSSGYKAMNGKRRLGAAVKNTSGLLVLLMIAACRVMADEVSMITLCHSGNPFSGR